MVETHVCEFCNSAFSSKSNLVAHQKRAKKCLKLRSETITEHLFSCEWCKKLFSTNQYLKKHTTTCKAKCEQEYKLALKQKEKTAVKTEKFYEKMMEKKDKQISDLLEKLGTIAEIGVKKDTVRVTNNIVNSMVPYDLTKQSINEIVNEKFTREHITGRDDGVATFAVSNLLKDESGKMKMTCTDTARRVFIYRDADGNFYRDVRADGFLGMYIPAVTKKSCAIASALENIDEIVEITSYAMSIDPSTIGGKMATKLVQKPLNESSL